MSYLKSYRNNRTFLHTAGTYMHAESIYLCHVKNVIRIMKRLLTLILWAGFAGKVFADNHGDLAIVNSPTEKLSAALRGMRMAYE